MTLKELRDELGRRWPESSIRITETWTHPSSRHQQISTCQINGAVHVIRDGQVVVPSPCALEYFCAEHGIDANPTLPVATS